jgi:CheY-like chemotaxis protein/8-oxo-dGTP pyrophosphatase MutT (NUDIX family)
MPDGGELSIRAAAEESGWVVIEVRDTGIGMTEEHSRLIENRALENVSTSRGGRGLAERASITERHAGNMRRRSEPARGTVLRLRLHASRFQIIPPAEGVVEPVHPEQASRILLVDDDPRLLTVLSDTLQACGHSVTTAVKGEDALEMFDSAKHEVVITDLGMPRMNGWEVAERVKARSPETPVFLLTGWGESVAAHEGSSSWTAWWPSPSPRKRSWSAGRAAPLARRPGPVAPKRPLGPSRPLRSGSPAEVYMIRRQQSMRFLGGYYAFPGGKVDLEDGASDILDRCRGITEAEAGRLLPSENGVPALAYWVAAARELLEETGVLPACDATGRPIATEHPDDAARIDALRVPRASR